MKVRLYGVKVELADDLTVGDLLDHIEHLDGYEATYRGRLRILHVDRSKGCSLLLVLTVKDHQRFLTMRRQGKDFEVSPHDFAEGTEVVDFNMLVVDEKSGKGLYQHYRDSMNFSTLQGFLSKLHDLMVTAKREEWIEEQPEPDAATVQRAARKRHKGKLKIVQMFDRATLAEFCADLDALTSMTIEMDGLADANGKFRAFSPVVETSRYSVKFSASMVPKHWATKIQDWVGKTDPKGARIRGREDGQDRTFDFFEPLAKSHKIYDFDEAIAPINPETFDRHVFIVDMIDIIKTNPDIFSADGIEGEDDDDEGEGDENE